MVKALASTLLCIGLSVFTAPFQAAVLPVGTNLEARLSTASGSRISRAGEPITAVVIAPVYQQNRLVVPQGAVLSGVVQSVDRLGLGINHRSARINYRFTSLELPDGTVSALEARTAEVEAARERVSPDGDIRGINPEVSLSSGASILISALIANVEFAVPALGVKFLIARSPDPEIYFPAGTELILQVTTDSRLPDVSAPPIVRELEQNDERAAQNLLAALPDQQTSLGKDRPSDLVNILLLGTHEQIARAFQAAGWFGEQRHSAMTLYRMYKCWVQRTGYSMAPMTRLRLNGEVPDIVYQKSLDTFAKRHHIRLWQQHGSDAWIGATTEDVAYTVRRMHVTHSSDETIDNERAKVVNDLWLTGCVSNASVLRREHLQLYEVPGLPIRTDGDVGVLRLNDCRTPLPSWVAGTRVPIIRRYKFNQILLALGNDVSHANPITVGYNLAKSILAEPTMEGANGFRNLPGRRMKPSFGESTSARLRWKRPSITDPEMAASPSLTAKSR